jgi:metaxin
VAFNDENGGLIERLREDGIVDLDAAFCSLPEWISMKAMVCTWLAEAVMYELWVGSDGTSARAIYYSDLPWLIGKALFMKQVYVVKQRFGITKENAERKEAEVTLLSLIIFFCNLLICALSHKYAHMHQCQKACTSAKKHAPVE